MQNIQEKLNKIVERLKPYEPEKIILYGSYARGDERSYSDIDLLIIKKTKKSYFERMHDIYKLLYKKEYYLNPEEFIGGLAPVAYTPQEIEKALEEGNFFFRDILSEGKVIYEQR